MAREGFARRLEATNMPPGPQVFLDRAQGFGPTSFISERVNCASLAGHSPEAFLNSGSPKSLGALLASVA
jgi:hypothetical protein